MEFSVLTAGELRVAGPGSVDEGLTDGGALSELILIACLQIL